jgi:hypothetical protein
VQPLPGFNRVIGKLRKADLSVERWMPHSTISDETQLDSRSRAPSFKTDLLKQNIFETGY